MNIRSRLALLFAGVGVIAVAVTSSVNYVTAEAALKVTVANQLVGLRSAKARHIESVFRDLRRTIDVKAGDSATERAFLQLRDAMHKEGAAKIRSLYASPSLNPVDRSARSNAGDNGPYTLAHRVLHSNFHDFRLGLGVADVFLCDAISGDIVYTDQKGADFGANLGEVELVRSGLAEVVAKCKRLARPAITDFAPYSASHNHPAAFLGAPIRSNGNVIGVFVIQIGLAQIDELASPVTSSQEGLGESGETLIIGSDLRPRNDSHSGRKQLTGQSNKESSASGTQNSTNFEPLGSIYEVALRGDGYMETVGHRGNKVLAAFEPLSIPGLHWALVVEQDQSEAYEPLDTVRTVSLYAGCGMLLVTLLLAYLVSGTFTRPLQKLSEAARKFGAGENHVRSGIRSQDEYGELGRSFDQMVAQQEGFEEAAGAIRRNIVHDLKTPVAVIKGMAETLEQPGIVEDTDLRSELIETIVLESDRLLDDLQDILLPVTADYKPAIERFDLSRLLMVTANLERHTSRATRHKITVEGADQPVWVHADRRKIRRVLENLVGNAVKYSPGDDKVVSIRLSQVRDQVHVSIIDEGLGMSAEELQKVMSDGGRVEHHAKMGIEGTGFGLQSVIQILRAHKGELRAVSEAGKGSEFTVVLPMD